MFDPRQRWVSISAQVDVVMQTMIRRKFLDSSRSLTPVAIIGCLMFWTMMASGLWSQNPSAGQAASTGQATPMISFGKDVRPILSKHCWSCHGPDEQKREAQLRLDRYEDAIQVRDGKAAIRPGDWKKSELMRRVESADASNECHPLKVAQP